MTPPSATPWPTCWPSRTPSASRSIPQARAVRALLLEAERLYNHVNDLGAIANDVGYGIAHTHTQRLREHLLRHNKALTGHRLLRGGITIGGAHLAEAPDLDLIRRTAEEVAEIVAITLDHTVVADRFTGTAVLTREQAAHIGTLGYVARACGIPTDARAEHPSIDLGDPFTPVVEQAGDVLARFQVRAREVAASAALIEDLTARISGPARASAAAGRGRRPAGATDTGAPPRRARRRRGLARDARAPRRAHRRRRAGPRPRRRPLVLQLAGPAGGPHRHDRPGLPAGQQELQPVLRRQRPLSPLATDGPAPRGARAEGHWNRPPRPEQTRGMTDELPGQRRHSWAEPYKIKMVEPLRMTTRAEREAALDRGRLEHVPAAQP